MVEYARANQVDLFISTGDLYDLATSTLEERDAVSDWVRAMANVCDVLLIEGNHGAQSDTEQLRKLESIGRIVVETGARVHDFTTADGEDFAVACLAWPDRANLLRGAGGDTAGADALASVALQNVLRGLGEQASGAPRRLLAMHAMVDGSVTSTGQPLVGAEMHVSLADIALAGCPINVRGHVHKAQSWRHGDHDIIYTGSPYRTNYGESEEKSVLLVEFGENNTCTWKRIPTPAAPMVHLAGVWFHGELSVADAPTLADLVSGGAYVRMRVTVPADERAAANVACAAWKSECLAAGAADVKVEIEAVPVNASRAPEVAKATTLADKLSAFWSARNTAPEADRAMRLLDKAQQLEIANEV